ncbi:MAG: sulfatase-like hydrolase/transferase [Acidaminococcaceae bacterium]
MKKTWWYGGLLLCLLAEAVLGWRFYQAIIPFPENECIFTILNNFLRDVLLVGTLALLYFRRGRLRDRCQRYLPVVVLAVLYLGFAAFMVHYLQLDLGFLTTLAILAGLFNNIVLCLLAAMCYYKWPQWGMKLVYFVVYCGTFAIMLFDGIYFWTTSMHVESVLFQNLNLHAARGVIGTTAPVQLALVGGSLVVLTLLFRVPQPHKRKPNFAWSLLCVAFFGLGLNLTYLSLAAVSHYAMDQAVNMEIEAEIDLTRQRYRNLVAMPINVNFVHKALFDTDKIIKNPLQQKRELTAKDRQLLEEMGILHGQAAATALTAQYDKVVLLVLESVHRDYLHYYNSAVPAEATPFLDSLLQKYPRLDHYYASAIPTTQGLNSTFRSQLIFDGDVRGAGQGSLYRQAQAAGWRGIYLNASSQYYNNEFKEYTEQFGMQEYYAREYLEGQGYSGASGWGYHNDVLYEETLKMLARGRADKMLLVTKTLDMHQPYPYYGYTWEEMPEAVRDHKLVTVRGMYWVDKTLAAFFRQAAAQGLMDERTLFIITADHNPHSGGEYKELVSNEADRQSIAPLPLIFVAKNLVPLDKLRTEEYASQIDLAPTLLHLMGLTSPPDFLGRNLLLPTTKPYALGYFGGQAYYFSEDLNFVDQLDNPYPATAAEDALANFIMWDYVKRHE